MVDFNSNENWPRQKTHNTYEKNKVDIQSKARACVAQIMQIVNGSWVPGGEKQVRSKIQSVIVDMFGLKPAPDYSQRPDHYQKPVVNHTRFATVGKPVKIMSPEEIGRHFQDSNRFATRSLGDIQFGTTIFGEGDTGPIGKILSTEVVDGKVYAKIKLDEPIEFIKQGVMIGLNETAPASKCRPDLPRRMWISQPSTHQTYHNLHGRCVLAVPDDDKFMTVYFVEGDTISQRVARLALADGWPSHLSHPKKDFYARHVNAVAKGAHDAIHGKPKNTEYLVEAMTLMAYNEGYDAVAQPSAETERANDRRISIAKKYCCEGRLEYEQAFLEMVRTDVARKNKAWKDRRGGIALCGNIPHHPV